MSSAGQHAKIVDMITVDSLTKRYGNYIAVDDVSFTARPGQVTGFLGPNGAGKSTTLRILAGLTPESSGQALVGGHRYRDIPNPARHVGLLLDASALHAGRTGYEALTISAKTMGLPRSRVDDALNLVSLSADEAKRRVKNYSLGMKQRLGIANALLGDPEILILDEPVNGLDPAGIRWMRSLLRDYANRGGTVLLSSHLLHEIEIIADEILVIGQGRIVAQGGKEELLAGKGTKVRGLDDAALFDALQAANLTAQSASDGAGFVVDADPAEVGQAAAAAGVALTELRQGDSAGLEDIFLQLTAGTQRETITEGAA